MPGVLGVFTGADVARDGLGSIPHSSLPSNRHDLPLRAPGGGDVFIGPHVLLPCDRARHVGEAAAMVVAETRAQAEDAVQAASVTWAPLAFVVDTAVAAGGPAPAAIARAIADALEPLGVGEVSVPATPYAIRRAIRVAQARAEKPAR